MEQQWHSDLIMLLKKYSNIFTALFQTGIWGIDTQSKELIEKE